MNKLTVVFNRDITNGNLFGSHLVDHDKVVIPKGTTARLLSYRCPDDDAWVTVALTVNCQYMEVRLPGEVVDLVVTE